MNNPYVQVSVGLVVIGLGLVVFAFLAALAGGIITAYRNVTLKHRLERLRMEEEVRRREDDMK